ncbi:MAG: membrane protein insertion efficiency factor YidD [Candidatus Omnitrophota bacterium]
MKRLAILLIKFYQNRPLLRPPCCKFYPSCSEYACSAIAKHSFLKAIFLASLRILKCNPFSKGGFDPLT